MLSFIVGVNANLRSLDPLHTRYRLVYRLLIKCLIFPWLSTVAHCNSASNINEYKTITKATHNYDIAVGLL